MKIIYLILALFSLATFAERIHTIDADCVRIKDGACIDKLELGYLEGLDSNIQDQIDSVGGDVSTKAEDDEVVHLTGDESISGVKTFTGKVVASSTSNGSRPCPAMTEAQRNSIGSPATGDCIYNTTTTTLNVYNGATWKSAGGGVNKWATSSSYQIDDVVISSNQLYIALESHTSGTFATDLTAAKWQLLHPLSSEALTLTNKTIDADSNTITNIENADIKSGAAIDAAKLHDGTISNADLALLSDGAIALGSEVSGTLPIANGGTNKALTVGAGKLAYTDADSFELLDAGTLGHVLQSNGAAPPTWVSPPVKVGRDDFSDDTVDKIVLPNNQTTLLDGNLEMRLETGNTNLLDNPSFEHATYDTAWTNTGTGTMSVEGTQVIDGTRSWECAIGSSETCVLKQSSSLYAASFADGVQGLASMWVKTDATTCQLCAVQAGVTSTTDCVAINSDNKWGLYKVPFILGATSNGVDLTCTTTSSKTVYADAAYVGAPDIVQDTQFFATGSVTTVPTANCTWTRTGATSFASFAADADCPVPSVSGGIVAAPATKIPAVVIKPNGATTYDFLITGRIRQSQPTSTDSGCSWEIYDGATSYPVGMNYVSGASSAVGVDAASMTARVELSSPIAANTTFEIRSAPTNSSTTCQLDSRTTGSGLKISVTAYGAGKTYSATCGANCENTLTGVFNGTTCAKESENVTGWVTSTTDTGAGLCTINYSGLGLSVKPMVSCMAEYSGGLRLAAQTVVSTTSALCVSENTSFAATDPVAYHVTVSKQGSDAKIGRTIVGSFKDNVISSNARQMNIKMGAVSCTGSSSILATNNANPGAWLSSITNVSTGACTITMSGFSSTPRCVTTTDDNALSSGLILSSRAASSTSLTIDCENDASVECTGFNANLICWEQL